MLNSPVGATKYEDEELPGEGASKQRAETGGTEMPVAPKSVVVKSG
jgi:hypothetical protein